MLPLFDETSLRHFLSPVLEQLAIPCLRLGQKTTRFALPAPGDVANHLLEAELGPGANAPIHALVTFKPFILSHIQDEPQRVCVLLQIRGPQQSRVILLEPV